MLIVVQVDAPMGQAIGIKEDLAMYLERFGDARVIEIKEESYEQGSLYSKGGRSLQEQKR